MDIATTLAFEHKAGADIWIDQWTPALRNAHIDSINVRRLLTMAEHGKPGKNIKKGHHDGLSNTGRSSRHDIG